MKVLVTGSGGFIGSHVCEGLVKAGHEVYGMDNGFTSTHDKLKGVTLVKADVRGDFNDIPSVDVVVHLAGLLGTNEIAELGQIKLANDVNINGTVNILDYCKKNKARLVFATKPNPRTWCNPYTITKMAAENYCIMYAQEYKVPTIALSLFWVYGNEQRQEPVNKFIPTFMKNSIQGKPIPIYNGGEQIIDCCYIDDIVEAFVRAVSLKTEERWLRIDVGTGIPVTINEVAQMVLKLTKGKKGTRSIGKRLGEPVGSALVADSSMCKRVLGFVPSIPLEKGLRKCLPWFVKKFK